MTQAKQRFQNFAEYLAYDDGTDKLYELFNGELVEVPPESGLNVEIANLLFSCFLPIVGHRRLRGHGLELEVRGEPKNRYPDMTILQPEHIEQLRQRNTLRQGMLPPALVVEVVSPGDLQRDRDYVAKRAQYQERGIPEYWIVDPQTATVLVLVLQGNQYVEAGQLRGDDRLVSAQFGALPITVAQLFTPNGSV